MSATASELELEDFDETAVAEASSNFLDEIEFFGDKELRWYQVAVRNGIVGALIGGSRRILVVLPTGAGKTLTIASTLNFEDMRFALGINGKRPMRVLFMAHKHRLLTQAEATFAAESGVDLRLQSAFTDVSPETLKWKPDVVVIDEAHHEAMTTIQYQLELIGEWPIIGLTATPDRADGHLIKFDTIINPISREDAVREGFLAPTRIHTFVDVPSREKVDVLMDIFDNYVDEMGQTMVFVKTKAEVRSIEMFLQSKGKLAVGVLTQTERQLDTLLNEFSAGNVQFIVNCNKINEGVDVQGCTDVILGRQFGSYPQLNQVIGRAARPDSDCNVWELINPLSGRNLDTTVVVGTPEFHRLIAKEGGRWVQREFDYVNRHVPGSTLKIGDTNTRVMRARV